MLKKSLFILSIILKAVCCLAQTPNTIMIPPVANPVPQVSDSYTRAAVSISLEPGFIFTPSSGLLNLNISSYPAYVNNNYQNPSTTPGFTSFNSGLEAAVTSGVANVDAIGAFNYNIPIVCSPGTAGMEPKLNINYNTNSENTWLGLGFNLTGISVISRTGKNLLNDGVKSGINLDANDVYVMDGARLLLKTGSGAGATYKTEIENYSTISAANVLQGSGPQYFTVTTPEGITMEYGRTTDSKRTDRSNAEVLSWYINKAYDNFGNYMTYSYTSNDGEILINEIAYTGNGSMSPYNKIDFSYVDRSDANSFYIAGKEFTRKHILKTITCKDMNGAVARSYTFDYQYQFASMLSRITETDASGNTLNPTFFEWTNTGITPSQHSNNVVTAADPVVSTAPLYQTIIAANLDGDGKSDLLLLENNTNTQVFNFQVQLNQAPNLGFVSTFPASIRNTSVDYITSFVFDEDDDNIDEVFVVYALPITNTSYQYYIDKIKRSGASYVVSNEVNAPLPANTDPHTWFQFSHFNPYSSLTNRSAFFYAKQDVSGDGVRDVILVDQTNLTVQVAGVSANIAISASTIIKTALGDFDGDNVADLYVLKQGSTSSPPYTCEVYKYNPSTAALNLIASTSVNTDNNPNLSSWANYVSSPLLTNYANASKSIDFGDFNGDGKTDIMFVKYDQNSNNAYINIVKSNGVTFLPDNNPLYIPTFLNTFEADFSAFDVNNDGYCDLAVNSHDPNLGVSYFDHYPSNGNFLTAAAGTHNYNDHIFGAMADFDGDNVLDYIDQGDFNGFDLTLSLFNQNARKFVTRIFNIRDNLKIQHDFLPSLTQVIGQNEFYRRTTPLNTDPAFKVTNPSLFVVTATDNNGRYFTYGYENAIYHETGKGLLGFEKTYTSDQNTPLAPADFRISITTSTYSSAFDDVIASESTQALVSGLSIFGIGSAYSDAQTTLNYVQSGNNRYLNSSSTSSRDYLASTYHTIVQTFDHNNGGQLLSSTASNLNWTTQQVINSIQKSYTYQSLSNSVNGNTYYKPLQLTEARTANGNTSTYITNFNYNTNGSLANTVENSNYTSLAITTSYSQYNAFGEALSISLSAPDLANPRLSSVQYDATGRFILQSTNTMGFTEQSQFEPTLGNLVQKTDASGLVTKFAYDGLGRLVKTTTPTGAVNTAKYEWYNYNSSYYGIKVTATREANGSDVIYYSNTGLELNTESSGFGGNTIVTASTYQSDNSLLLKTEPHFSNQSIFKQISYVYDAYARIRTMTESKNDNTVVKTVNYTYNNLSTNSSYVKGSLQVNTPAGNGSGILTTITENNEAGQIDKVINYETSGSQHTSVYTFNEHNKPTQMVTSFPGGLGGSTTLFTYDALGRKLTINDPSSGVTTTHYNSIGELLSSDKNGIGYTYSYDNMSRLVTKTGTGTDIYTYDYVTTGNGLMALKKITGPNVITEFTYDGFNRTSQKKETLGSGTTAKQFLNNYTYDKYNRLLTYTYPGNFSTSNEYDVNGFLNKIKTNNTTIWQLNSMLSPDLIQSYYNSSGTSVQFTYDNFLNLSQKTLGSISTQGFTIDHATSNMLNRSHTTSVYNYEAFSYDNFDRLKNTEYLDANNNLQIKQNFTYNDNGNLNHKDDCGDYAYSNSSKPYQLSQIQHATPDVSYNTLNVTHTAFNKALQITESTSNKEYDLTYGNFEQRIKMEYRLSSQLQYTRYYQDNYDREETSSGYREWSYINTPSGLAAVYYNNNGTGQLLDITTDNLGNPILLTNTSGGVEEEYSFDAWGRRRNPHDWTYNNIPAVQKMIRGYTGHEHLDELALVNMNGRIYYPIIGRFVEPDPFVQDPADLQNLNRYSYVLNNPLKYIDPSGYKTNIPAYILQGDRPAYDYFATHPPVIFLDGVRIENGDAGYNMLMGGIHNGGGGLGIATINYLGVWEGSGPVHETFLTRAYLMDYANANPGSISDINASSVNVQLKYLGKGQWLNPLTGEISKHNDSPSEISVRAERVDIGQPGGRVNAFGFSFAFGGGYQFEIGKVTDANGDSKWYISHGPVIGVNLSVGFSEKSIRPRPNKTFNVNDYSGPGSGYSLGLFFGGVEYSGNRRNDEYRNTDWKFDGDNYNQLGFGLFTGLDFGVSWSRTNTSFILNK